eukprot:CAMPEP_0117648412 /NCGR_PEP_ID=MMETSP0804-20121206/387_1 /TAXON_ID=1074897 /ORGANISM="Tetraselmis astigmatica, Strain CCMP880" /LENGTH=152 /DNA_ID=CAMNT_0005454005 /DNA_START=51 /DNA_END=506 /DNA_ORIENTATION=-
MANTAEDWEAACFKQCNTPPEGSRAPMLTATPLLLQPVRVCLGRDILKLGHFEGLSLILGHEVLVVGTERMPLTCARRLHALVIGARGPDCSVSPPALVHLNPVIGIAVLDKVFHVRWVPSDAVYFICGRQPVGVLNVNVRGQLWGGLDHSL